MSEKIISVTDSSFELQVLSDSQPVLLDFWAPWCGPCKAIAQILKEIAEDSDGKLKVCKMNVDEHNETAAKYNIRGIPTLMLFKHGEVVGTKVGVLSKSDLQAFIAENT